MTSSFTTLAMNDAASPTVPESTPEKVLTPACREPTAQALLRKRTRDISPSPCEKSARARTLTGYRAAGIKNPLHEILESLKSRMNPDKTLMSLANGDPAAFPHLKPSEAMHATVSAALATSQEQADARKHIAETFSVPGRPQLEASDVFMSLGCSEALSHCIEALAVKGGNMLLPRPCFPLYEVLCRYHGLEVRHYNLLADKDWQIDVAGLAAIRDENTVAMFLNNPSNPTGAVYSRAHLEEVMQVVAGLGLPVVADEVFCGMSFKEPFYHCAAVNADVPVLSVGALSKKMLAPGWRVGWVTMYDARGAFKAAGVPETLQSLCRIDGPSEPLEAAVPAILNTTPALWYKSALWSLEQSAHTCMRRVAQVPGLSIDSEPSGSMYLMVRIEPGTLQGVGEDDVAFAHQLLEEESVAVLPGQCFGAPGFFRIVFAATPAVLEHAWDRIEVFCRRRYNKEQ